VSRLELSNKSTARVVADASVAVVLFSTDCGLWYGLISMSTEIVTEVEALRQSKLDRRRTGRCGRARGACRATLVSPMPS
jgi:hypothetical protein